ncbi:MAG: hypothetical protein IJX75_03970 [Clostridia bacterium]|nr:hypothetical protein [Clostridia bacterium]
MLKTEKNYDFKTDLLCVHKKGVRDWTLMAAHDEFVFKNGTNIVLLDTDDEVILTAAKDLVSYLFVSMDVSAMFAKAPNENAANVTLCLGSNLGEAEGYMGYRITTNQDGITIEGHDTRGVAQGIYYLEDLMNLRKAPFVKTGKVERKALFSPRITQSPFGMYEYPDEAFSWIARNGYDAIDLWLQDAYTDNRGQSIDIRLISERAAKYGVDVYVQLYAPHNKHPDDEDAQEFYDALYGELFDVCPKLKGVTLLGEANQFASRDPAVGKTPFTANFKDNIPTGKTSPGWWPCNDYPAWTEMVAKAIWKKRPDAEVIFCTYNWGFAPKEERIRLIEALPKGISLMTTWDMFHQYKMGNSVQNVWDYSLAFIGPGEYFSSEALAAKKRGIKLIANSQTAGRTWDFGVIPYEPMPQRWIERYQRMRQAHEEWNLAGLLECIHYGFHPSIISELEKQAFFTQVEPLETTLKKLLQREYGKHADVAERGMTLFSEAIAHYVPCNEDMYGGFRIGPAYPLWSGVMEGLPATIPQQGKMPSSPHAMFGNGIYFGIYTPDSDGKNSLPGVRIFDEIQSISKMETLFGEGIAVLESAQSPNNALLKLINLAKFMRNCCRTVLNVKKHYILKQRLSIAGDKTQAEKIIQEIETLLLNEKENVLDTLPLVRADSRLGWEASMEYTTDEKGLKWKLRQLDYELTIKLPTYRKANALI